MKKRLLSILVVLSLCCAALAGCQGADKSSEGAANEEEKTQQEEIQGGQEGEIASGEWVVGLSNSYYGNTWRKQMVDSFTTVAEEAKEKGYIKDFIIQNGDNTVNAQIAQINSFILQGVDIICINAASPTALNSVIDKAVAAGIQVVAFDSTVTNESAYTMDYDFVEYGKVCGNYIADRLENKGNIVMVRGVSGTTPDEQMYQGYQEVLDENPDMKVVATVLGEASSTVAQEEFAKILPSLKEVDAVMNQGGDSYGMTQAFEQAGREVPIIIGDNSAEFIQWWRSQDNYETMSMRAAPACGSAAFWTALYILNGEDVPKKMIMAFSTIGGDELDQYADMEAGTIAGADWTPDKVMEEIIVPAREKQE